MVNYFNENIQYSTINTFLNKRDKFQQIPPYFLKATVIEGQHFFIEDTRKTIIKQKIIGAHFLSAYPYLLLEGARNQIRSQAQNTRPADMKICNNKHEVMSVRYTSRL